MEWLYSTDLFGAQTMARMAAHYTTLLGKAIANPEARISTLDYLTAVERAEQEAAKREHQSSKASQLRGAKRKTVSL
jgi:non-ribosomal peptide synthetase component F